MPGVFLTHEQIALLALIPKHQGMTPEALAQATNFKPRIVIEQLQGLTAGGLLVHEADTGEYRQPEKHDV